MFRSFSVEERKVRFSCGIALFACGLPFFAEMACAACEDSAISKIAADYGARYSVVPEIREQGERSCLISGKSDTPVEIKLFYVSFDLVSRKERELYDFEKERKRTVQMFGERRVLPVSSLLGRMHYFRES